MRSDDVDRAGAVLPAAVTTLQTLTGVDLVDDRRPPGRVVASTDPLLVDEVLPWPRAAGRARSRAAPGRSSCGHATYLVAAVPILSDPTHGEPVTQLGIAMVGAAEPDPTGVAGQRRARTAHLPRGRAAARRRRVAAAGPVDQAPAPSGWSRAEIAGLAEQREAIFAGIAEGVIALDTHHRITLANEPAIALLSLPADPVGPSLDDLAIAGTAARRADRRRTASSRTRW